MFAKISRCLFPSSLGGAGAAVDAVGAVCGSAACSKHPTVLVLKAYFVNF